MQSPHSICWVDLGTADPSRTARFYAGLFGWTVTEPDADGYRICLQDGRPVAGLGPSEGTGEPYWSVNVRVDEVAVTARAVVAAGGTLPVPPVADVRGWDAPGSRWLVSFAVADVERAAARALDLGARPVDARPGPSARLSDPSGAAFRLAPSTAARVGTA